jgi:hypothetical protein
MQFLRLFGCVACVSSVAVGACGGASDSPLEDPPSSFTAGSADASTAPPPAPTGTTAPPSSGSDAGSKHDASVPHDAAPLPPSPSTEASVDSAPIPPADPGVACGKATCDPATQVCCVMSNGFGGGGGSETYSCDTASDCTSNGGLAMPCVKPADCIVAGSPAGTVCCVTEGTGNQSAASVACVDPSQCANPSTQAWMCDPSAPQCPTNAVCTVSTVTVPPYSICVAH